MNNSRQRLINGALPFLATFYALVSLVVVTGGQRDLTAALAAEVGVLVILWLCLSFGLMLALRYLANLLLEEPVETPVAPRPDPLNGYLNLKKRYHDQYFAEWWWDPVENDHFSGHHDIELTLSAPVYRQILAWNQTKGLSINKAVEALLIHGLADDELDKNTIRSEWLDWLKEAGGPSWM